MQDSLGDRMKSNYEDRYRYLLQRRTYTIIRVDGKAFHTYTRGLVRPFDDQLIADMNITAAYLCTHIQGAKFAFVQSDEISVLLTDFDQLTTDAWFDNNVQKMASISASLATAKFNELRPGKLALFDSRVFQVPTKSEAENYFIWRQQDTVRNSISSAAQFLYSPKQLHGKSTNEMQEMMFQKGVNWNDYASDLKRGRLIKKIPKEVHPEGVTQEMRRTEWSNVSVPIFTQERHFLSELIPDNI